MKISTELGSISQRVGREKAIEMAAKAGFDAFDFSMVTLAGYDNTQGCRIPNPDDPLSSPEYLQYVRHLRQVADDNGLPCNQSHAPFPVRDAFVRSMLLRAIECTAEIGGKICVIHPNNDKSAEENADMYRELLPFAKSCGVKIATENMWNWDDKKGHARPAACSHHDDFLAHIEAVNDPFLVACVDVGHAQMRGLNTSAVDMIRTLKHHVQALHIHDNDLINDNHQIPFSLNIDYAPIVKALKDIDYTGYFTLEANAHFKANPGQDTFSGVLEMAHAARRLADMFESL